ncbi:DUF5946 family protein [Catellatospora sp. NPDC049609]|uniref:DUF5946 family protein n=1 Tax=Catellatospora sp. NPDC049609 TaxID=3155505 RepID=UPI00343288E5
MEACPGCGVELPGNGWDGPRHSTASGACWQLYGELGAYVLEHSAVLGRWQQTTVDAYAAQHTGPDTPVVATAFALNGLYLVFERGLTGPQVRAAHSFLAQAGGDWPRFAVPAGVGPYTVFDVALADGPDGTAAAIAAWGRGVWDAWRPAHAEIAALTDRRLSAWRP